MPLQAQSGDNESMKQLERVDAVLEQALDLTPAERKELIETLLFFDMMMSERRPDSGHIDED